ncbi:MAG: ferrous iron transport protein A [Cyclobacteriaceae bacterium]|nr:ferrous iron transport protein A [Cyclobacteriaceae bacterium]
MTLDKLQLNFMATVKSISINSLSPKLLDMGLFPGKEIRVVFKAPFGDPIAVDVEGYILSLRKDEASLVEVA